MAYLFSIYDLILGILMVVMGRFFYNSNGRASKYIAGYNTKTEDEKKKFDEIKLCRTYGKRIKLWSIPFFAGCVIDLKFSGIGFALEFAFLVVFLIWHTVDIRKNINEFKIK